MIITLNEKEVLSTGFTIIESLDQYCTTVEMTTEQIVAKEGYALQNGSNSIPLTIESIAGQTGGYRILFEPTKYTKLKNSTMLGYYGDATVETLVQSMGIELKSKFKTLQSFWNIPECKIMTLIDTLNKYTTVSNGGGSRFYIDILGNLNFCDLKSSYESIAEVTMFGDVLSEQQDKSWTIINPGVVNISKYTTEGVSNSEYKIVEGYGKGSYRIKISDERSINLPEQILKNEFYRKYYTSHIVKLSTQPSFVVFLGQPLKVKNSIEEKPFIVYESRRTINPNGIQDLQLTLVSCQK